MHVIDSGQSVVESVGVDVCVVRCSAVAIFAGLYGFYLAKKSVDKNRVEMMKTKQRLRAAAAAQTPDEQQHKDSQ